MKKYRIETYGCQMNLADSELIAGILEEAGWMAATDLREVDAIIVNTCSVRQRAAERVVGHVRSMKVWKRRRPGLRIVVVGCLPQHLGADLADRLPEVDLFVGPDSYRRLPRLLERSCADERLVLRRDRREAYQDLCPLRRQGVNAWVSIMRGCDRFCSYCAVPFGRGRERSLRAEYVIRAVEQAISEGFVTVTLLGQAVTSYRDGSRDFAWLLERLAGIGGLLTLRFLSPHPADFSPRVLEVIARHLTIARHMHLPLQAGSNRILKAMRRGYTRESYLQLVRRTREMLPGVGVTTDIMVGFPGETREDFRQTIEMMNAIRFDSAFMFAYSPRERTYAARFLKDDVPAAEKKLRLTEVIDLQQHHSRERFSQAVGETREVLLEGPAKSPKDLLFGRCGDFKATVFAPLPGQALSPGRVVRVQITQASSHTLRGRQVD